LPSVCGAIAGDGWSKTKSSGRDCVLLPEVVDLMAEAQVAVASAFSMMHHRISHLVNLH